jgi:hypothetical protein
MRLFCPLLASRNIRIPDSSQIEPRWTVLSPYASYVTVRIAALRSVTLALLWHTRFDLARSLRATRYAKIGWPSSPKNTGMPVRKEWVRAMAICAASRASCGGVGTARSGTSTRYDTRGHGITPRDSTLLVMTSYPTRRFGSAIGIGCGRESVLAIGIRLATTGLGSTHRCRREYIWRTSGSR